MIRLLALIGACATWQAALADEERAEVNYMLHCQGCHLPEAAGFAGRVPPMRDFAGFFLHSDEGREYLVRVPGVAGSALPDAEIAELLNWLLERYSNEQLPAEFQPFTAAEVAALRTNPVHDPARAREAILADLARRMPRLAPLLRGTGEQNDGG